MTLRKRSSHIALALVACFALSSVAHGSDHAAATGAGQQLEGSWLITVTFDETPAGFPNRFPVMHTFLPGGGVLESNSLPNALAAGHGEWLRTGNREFRYTFQFFVRGADGNALGIARVRSVITVNDTTTRLTGRFIGEIFDFAGVRLLLSEGTYQGQRIALDLKRP